ncbi:peptidylprolyl isomerase [Capnocytophaga canis]|uniref:peptidylprolyl isomerase n=1 Tax=Capnocytophaga canis TaxID=1848903 RepID=UPI0037D7541C
MRYSFLSMLCIFILLGCNDRPQKANNSLESVENNKEVTEENLVKEDKSEKEQEIFEPLTTQSAIPFLFEYEKRHKERYVRIITDYGNIDIELFVETPYHRANFILLTKEKYFDGSVFHRVVKNFVIQGGNSDSWVIHKKRHRIGQYLLPPDTKKGFKHHRGVVSMPSSDIENPHKFASPYEFFIVVQDPGAYHLDGGYTAFGKVIQGMDVVDKISQVETDDQSEWPKRDVKMKVEILK